MSRNPRSGRRGRLRLVVGVTVALVVSAMVAPAPVAAPCHIAEFEPAQYTVREDAGQVQITVHLRGETSPCSGTVSYETVDGTAKAPQDYTARSGELTFVAGDDRRESFTVPIVDDDADEPNEVFRARLTGATGELSADPNPAQVTIRDNDEPAPAAKSPDSPTSATGGSDPITPAPDATTPSPTAQATASPTASPTATSSPTATPLDEAAAGDGSDDGGSAGAIAGALVAVLAVGGALAWTVWRRRRSAGPGLPG